MFDAAGQALTGAAAATALAGADSGLMLALGETNWKLSRSLERLLPHLNLEGGHDVPSPRTPPMESESPA